MQQVKKKRFVESDDEDDGDVGDVGDVGGGGAAVVVGGKDAEGGAAPAASEWVVIHRSSKEEMDKDWPFEVIKKNVHLTKRPRRIRRSDDEYPCECRPKDDDPESACGEHCINRALKIECDPKT